MKYSELVSISPGFKPSVNIKNDLNNDIKIHSYIPTKDKIDLILDISESLVNEGNRVRHFTGAVGTGKSNLGLIVANYFKQRYKDDKSLPMNVVMQKISNIDKVKCDKLISNRKKVDGNFVVVVIEGYYKSINQALISELDRTLQSNAELKNLMPLTAYNSVNTLIEEWQKNHQHIFMKLEESTKNSEYCNVQTFIEEINNYNEKALEYFQSIYFKLTGVESFYSYQAQKASDVYNSVAEELLKKGYSGILVIWDEFGSNLERLVSDIDGTEYLELQKFAENCNQLNQRHQIHLLLISHNSVRQLASRTVAAQKQLEDKNSNLSKFEGRFAKVKRFSYDSEEIYNLIINLIIKNNKSWDKIIPSQNSHTDILVKETFENGIFHSFTFDYLFDLTKRAIPLHPFSLYTLIRICDKFAQNERSAFTFMSSNTVGTFVDFCNKENVLVDDKKLKLLLPNGILDYFYEDIQNNINLSVNSQYRETFIAFERAVKWRNGYSDLQINILKALLLINLVGPYNFLATCNNLAYVLGMTTEDEREEVRRSLDELCLGDRKVLAFSKVHLSYRFMSLKFDLELSVKKRIKELESSRKFDVITYINNKKGELGLPEYIESPEYRTRYKLNRKYLLRFVKADQLKNVNIFEDEIKKNYLDGLALFVLPETNSEIEIAKKYTSKLVNHEQILLGIPKETIKYTEYIKELSTLEIIDDVNEILDDNEKSNYNEEKDIYIEEVKELIKQQLELISDFKNQKNVNWYVSGVVNKVNDLEEFICSIMEKNFNRMPIVSHKSLLSDEGSDGQKTYRISVIDKMFLKDAVSELINEEQAPIKTIINTVLRECNILKPDEFSRPLESVNSNAFFVWEEIENYIIHARNYCSFVELFESLKRPPYGIKQRLIPLFLAAVLSKQINNIYIQSDRQVNSTIDGTIVEDICENPKLYSFKYCELNDEDCSIINCLENVFKEEINSTPLRVRNSVERIGKISRAINDWWAKLPHISKCYEGVSKEALYFKVYLLNNIEKAIDKKECLLSSVKKTTTSFNNIDSLTQTIGDIKDEYENILNKIKALLYSSIINILREFSVVDCSEGNYDTVLMKFYEQLDDYQKQVVLTSNENKVRTWLKNMTSNYHIKDNVLDITTKLTGISIEDWQNKHIVEFNTLFKSSVKVLISIKEKESPTEQNNDGTPKSKVSFEIDGNVRSIKVPIKLDDFTIETKNLLDAMLDDVKLSQEEEIYLLIRLLEERIK